MKRRARLHLFIFLAAVFTISFAIEGAILHRGGLKAVGAWPVFALMWTPGVVALVMRLARLPGLPAFGFRPPRLRWMLLAYLLPPVVALLAYGLGWSTALAPFHVPQAWSSAGLARTIAVNSSLGIAFGSLFALGEEIGWRGLMVPLLVDAQAPAPLVLSGLIWGAWHAPLILVGDYATSGHPILSAALFVVAITGASVSIGWIRMASASLWPAMLFHASHNAFFQSVFDRLTESSATSQYVVGESGAFPAVFYGIVAAWLVLTGRARRAIDAATPPAAGPLPS